MNTSVTQTAARPEARPRANRSLWARLNKNKLMYLMILPGLIYFLIFKYLPMWGLVIAFQNYQPFLGIRGSEWVGFEHFERLFNEPTFWMLFRNTITLFILNLVFYFPVPIILALMLNEVRVKFFQRTVQTLIYIPHFMSWAIIVSLTYVMFTTQGGLINEWLASMGFQKISFLTEEAWFRPLYVMQVIWREAGWGTIIYLAAIAAVDVQLYEAARMDGAGRFRQLWHVTLPAIRSTIIVLLILKVGDILELGFDHIFLMLNGANREVAEIFDTYVYTAGLRQGQFSYSAAVGFFKAAVGLVMIVFANKLAKRYGEEGIY
ncbi:ABC transporter permease [Paenibacillus thermoaerophilus]|uniref:ABC transporter permease n=1 Tax=Paenibacillus thermoaerophilus TaxID=1215385 RepID=A0ABW2V077_9BACL|nr:sugar ABC transporter permease [Paenibacillus thermoaerophilus]TMV17739.1 sugar ABC transporter permease [Paenibacillus thermoaerophilus]